MAPTRPSVPDSHKRYYGISLCTRITAGLFEAGHALAAATSAQAGGRARSLRSSAKLLSLRANPRFPPAVGMPCRNSKVSGSEPFERSFCDRASRMPGGGHFDREPIEGRLHVRRELRPQLVVVEIGMEIGQDRAPGLDPFDPAQRIVDTEMAGMRAVAQRIHDPDFGPRERSHARLRQAAQVAGIGKRPEAKAQRGNIAVLLQDRQGLDWAALPVDAQVPAGLEPVLRHDRRVLAARRRLEAIIEARAHRLRGGLVQIDVDPPPPVEEEPAQVVDAVGMIGVLVGEEHGVQPVDLGVEQLLAQVGRGVDQHAGNAHPVAPLHQQRRPAPPVPGIAGIAVSPAQGGTRNAAGGAAAEDCEAERHAVRAVSPASCASGSAPAEARGTLWNSRKKFSLVCRAICSGDMARVSARTPAVSTTKAGSLRLPRWRPGARYGASVSTRMRSAGSARAMARSSSDFLNVRMPVNEMKSPSAIARRASSRPPV